MQHHWGGHWQAVPPAYDHPAAVVFAVPTGLGFQDHQVSTVVSQAISGDVPSFHLPERLLKFVGLFGPGTKPGDEPPGPELSLERFAEEGEDDEYGWSVWFQDWVAHREEDRVRKMVRLLQGSPHIRECIHSDRELILFDSDLNHDELDALIHSLWATT